MEQNIPEQMLAASQDIEEQMNKAGKQLKAYIVEKETPDGKITVRVDGSMEIRRISIDGEDINQLTDLLNETLEAIRAFQEQKLSELPFVQAMQEPQV